jgi:hypothetical protein
MSKNISAKNLFMNFKMTKVKAIKRNSLSSRIFWITMIGFLFLFLSFYIFQVGTMIQKTSLIKEHENEINYLVKHNKELEFSFSTNNSLKNIEESLEELNFEKITQVDYIRVMGTEVAAK